MPYAFRLILHDLLYINFIPDLQLQYVHTVADDTQVDRFTEGALEIRCIQLVKQLSVYIQYPEISIRWRREIEPDREYTVIRVGGYSQPDIVTRRIYVLVRYEHTSHAVRHHIFIISRCCQGIGLIRYCRQSGVIKIPLITK